MKKAFCNLLDGLDTVSRWAIVACMATMISVVSVQVALRYGFSSSLDWAEEVSRLTFVWAVFMAIPHGAKAASHVGIDVLVKHLPTEVNSILQRAIKLASAVLLGIVAVQATYAARDNWDQMMPTLDLSSGWFYLAVTIGAAHSAFHLIYQALVDYRVMPSAVAGAAE